ncbi:hypothetical protein ACWDCC_41765 [Streptomyces sp. NPDC001102]
MADATPPILVFQEVQMGIDPTVLACIDAVIGSRLRLALTSRHPGEAAGAVRVSELEVPAG